MFRSILNSYDSRTQSYTPTIIDNVNYTIYTGSYELCDKYKYIYLSCSNNLQIPDDQVKIYYTNNIKSQTKIISYTDSYHITSQAQTLLISPKDKYFYIEIISPNNSAQRIYNTYLSNEHNKIHGIGGYPLEINSDGSINANITNNLFTGGVSFMGNNSTSIDISSAKNITIFGTASTGNSFSLQIQLSNDNNTFYSTQYVYKSSNGGDFGFTLPPISAKYIRFYKDNINVNITALNINYTK
jgi:hypothetical protein